MLVLAGCSAGSDADDADGPVTMTFWGWAGGYAEAVKEFNRTHPDMKVEFQQVVPGVKGGYQKMLNAVQAGDAPCLAQVGYESLPSFAAQGALTDVSTYASADKGDFQSAAWQSVSLGEAVYGAPVDVGPMAMFYNKKVFDSLGLKPAKTWAEYKKQAKKIRDSKPGRFISSPYLNYDYAGLAWQGDAGWFATQGDAWKVTMDSKANEGVADYWQGLTDDGLMGKAPMYDQSWYRGLGDGSIVTVVGAAWQAGVIKGGAKDGAGDWAVAPLPQWKAGEERVGNAGGSSTAVLKGCKSPESAWTFAHWLSTDKKAWDGLITKASLYPAAKDLLSLPQLNAPDPYFGGQNIHRVFAEAAPKVGTDWTWGPVMAKTVADLDDGLSRAWAGKGTIPDALRTAQEKTLAEMKSQGLRTSE
ncbi:ABC transporter substrate-binding protein [Streptomyces sp. M41]|uniref:ABC transporter substrate-binding protein n=1 Tax=Streptomyces sp. M41 TaxID=3059412 RepID=UPI00374DCA32